MSTPINPVPNPKPAVNPVTSPTPPVVPLAVPTPPVHNPTSGKVNDPPKPSHATPTPTLATGAIPPALDPQGRFEVPVNDVHMSVEMPGHKIGLTRDGFNPPSKLVFVGDTLEFHNFDDVDRHISFNQDFEDMRDIKSKTFRTITLTNSGRLFALSNGKQCEFNVQVSRKS